MSKTVLDFYVDGWMDQLGKEVTIVPRVKFPFKFGPTPPDTYARMYERDYEIYPGSLPRIDVRTAWTNLVSYSEEIDNAGWTKSNLAVTADS